MSRSKTGTQVAAAALAAVVALVMTACGGGNASSGSGDSQGKKVSLSLVAYSTPQAAYEKIIKAFQATPEGKNVTFTQSYGASGDQSRAVAAGLNADVVAFSLEPDMTRLVDAGLVTKDWNTDATKGMVTDSVVVIATRKGNPKHLRTWGDLTKRGVEVITPNPFTSGGARWNVMAGYGAVSDKGANKAAGITYLNGLFKNVPVQDDSARKALQTFTSGKGDAMLAYENEAIFAQQNGQAIDYTLPDSTILIENPVAVTSKSKHPTEAKAFVAFLHSKQAQQIFVENGYRPVEHGVPGADKFPTPSGLFTIKDLGGWPTVMKEFFDTQNGAVAAIERDKGVSVKK
ncbi:sulfate ABC transporter substrate-binding protein [Actinopolymorpha sp. NPDC004070]|uniref:sulfate ABC transporter substrate-binding protein n=1 Tax=Actinopolymorpha sp. NPDC004070 TaxID=3154548 RepID=UPI0033A117AA